MADEDAIDSVVSAREAAGLVEAGSGLLPGLPGHIVGAGANIVGSIAGNEEDTAALAKSLGVPNLHFLEGQSTTVQHLLEEMDEAPTRNLAKYGAAAAGSIAGAALGTVVLPIPIVGSLVGGAVGGFLGNRAYSSMHEDPSYNPVAIAASMRKMQDKHEVIDKIHGLLAMSGSLTETQREMLNEAVADAHGSKTQLSHVAEKYAYLVEDKAEAILGKEYNPNDPSRDALDQLMDKINIPSSKTGEVLNPVVLLLNTPEIAGPTVGHDGVALDSADLDAYAKMLEKRGIPAEEARAIADRMNRMGVSADEDGAVAVVPQKGGAPSRA